MKLPFPINADRPSAIRETFLAIRSLLESTFSWPYATAPDLSTLPNPLQYDRRTLIVWDSDGAGTPGKATALNGVWYVTPIGSAV